MFPFASVSEDTNYIVLKLQDFKIAILRLLDFKIAILKYRNFSLQVTEASTKSHASDFKYRFV